MLRVEVLAQVLPAERAEGAPARLLFLTAGVAPGQVHVQRIPCGAALAASQLAARKRLHPSGALIMLLDDDLLDTECIAELRGELRARLRLLSLTRLLRLGLARSEIVLQKRNE